MDGQGIPDAVTEFWETFLDDVTATAEEYRDAGWDVLQLHPGDVEPQPNPLVGSSAGATDDEDDDADRLGFDVLVPGDEFETLEDWLADGFDVSGYETFRAETDGATFVLVVEEDEASERAVLVPLHYTPSDAAPLQREALDRGVVHAYVRPLSRRRIVTFAHEDPELFFPADDEPAE